MKLAKSPGSAKNPPNSNTTTAEALPIVGKTTAEVAEVVKEERKDVAIPRFTDGDLDALLQIYPTNEAIEASSLSDDTKLALMERLEALEEAKVALAIEEEAKTLKVTETSGPAPKPTVKKPVETKVDEVENTVIVITQQQEAATIEVTDNSVPADALQELEEAMEEKPKNLFTEFLGYTSLTVEELLRKAFPKETELPDFATIKFENLSVEDPTNRIVKLDCVGHETIWLNMLDTPNMHKYEGLSFIIYTSNNTIVEYVLGKEITNEAEQLNRFAVFCEENYNPTTTFTVLDADVFKCLEASKVEVMNTANIKTVLSVTAKNYGITGDLAISYNDQSGHFVIVEKPVAKKKK